MNDHSPTTPADKAQWELAFAEARAKKLQRAQENLERRETRRKAPYKYVATVSNEKREQAEQACAQLHGMSVLAWFHAGIEAFANSPQGFVSRKDRERRKGFQFSSKDDKNMEKRLEIYIEETISAYPDGYTMADLLEISENEPEKIRDRSMTILYGRIMKNLGYRRVRTYTPATEDSPAKVGWIYRKEEQDTWPPSAA